MTILVIAEHDHAVLASSTLKTLEAAKHIAEKAGGGIHLLVCGWAASEAVANQAASIPSVEVVKHVADASLENFLAEDVAPLIVSMASDYTHVIAPATTFGKDIMPRAAALLDVAQISDVMEVVEVDTFKRPIYAGNAIATVQSSDAIKVMTVRTASFGAVESAGGSASVESVSASLGANTQSQFVRKDATESDRPELTNAARVVSGGRGMGSSEQFNAALEPLAEKLGAAIGASRAAVDAGYAPNDYQVGQTGKIIAPDLYIAIGISGAIQHLAGMKESKIIVAINKDENAPIFSVADYGLVMDLFDAVPELTSAL